MHIPKESVVSIHVFFSFINVAVNCVRSNSEARSLHPQNKILKYTQEAVVENGKCHPSGSLPSMRAGEEGAGGAGRGAAAQGHKFHFLMELDSLVASL